ncbi:hypothetical protein [Segetibacter koreensis]|uniref:hypothetical protein n=1 Tax=Segetibacter koreensis TaxID=398037 RepID=UPI0003667A27|nr:hypothetical protein [Segetibacter koreensis]
MSLKILFLNSSIPNYVTDGLFHGLRSISGVTVIDIPRIDYMYADASHNDLIKTGSRGNTLYKLLDTKSDENGKRTFWQEDLEEYNYIVFTDIFHQCDLFQFIYYSIHPKRRKSLCIVDGYDVTSMFPFIRNSFNLRVRPWAYLYNIKKVNYFKREYENTGTLYGLSEQRHPVINKLFSKILKKPVNLLPISMSIPKQHIEFIPVKEKFQDFVNYNVDNDLSALFPERPLSELGKWQPVFENQNEYFNDIRRSKFGVTAKRAGWDCLRHYEYAAKGAILCFKDLKRKSDFCAPFGLNNSNCIIYDNKLELLNTIKSMSIWQLESIQEAQYKWIANFTTEKVALHFIDQLELAKTTC